ncbi:MAG: thioredoxin family protein [Prolixibacteraceae bacterium]|jgi:peroxiredoxin|nr:thioredoxin family protein [Prolixibacteraceae bacterium]
MKNLLFSVFLLTVSAGWAVQPTLSIGGKASHTEVKMKSVSGTSVSLNDLKGENGLVLIFSCNTCPFVLGWENRYNEIYNRGKSNGIGVAVVNSNHQKRDGDESLEAMKKHAAEKSYQFPYLLDHESLLANSFGGQTTPHVFLFDRNFQLVYKGAIDDNYKDVSAVKNHYLKDAMQSLATGKPVAVSETKPMGCSIKRKLD